MDKINKWLTIDELAGYIKMSRTKLFGMARHGEIPASKIGTQWRFDREEIDQCMKAHAIDIDEIVRLVRFPGWQNAKAGECGVQKALRKMIYVKYEVKGQDLFDKAFGYIRQYY